MNLTGLEKYMREQRNKTFASSPQLTLGEIIEKIEQCGLTYGDKDKSKSICFDFGPAVPTELDSWRGSYSELALGYKLTGYDSNKHFFDESTAKSILEEMKQAVGKEYTGWKGGEFLMNEETPVWVANSGNSGNTGIVAVVDDGCRIILMTAYCEY